MSMSKWLNWTEEELRFLQKHYPIAGAKWIAGELGRPVEGVRQKAYKLGVKADRETHWGDNWLFFGKNPYEKILSIGDIAYIAGIFDGEGSVDIKRGSWKLVIGNTNLELIDWLHRKVPYSRVYLRMRRKPHWKDMGHWMLMGNLKISALLTLLQPYLIVKREKVGAILADTAEKAKRLG